MNPRSRNQQIAMAARLFSKLYPTQNFWSRPTAYQDSFIDSVAEFVKEIQPKTHD